MRATNPRKAMKCGIYHTRVLVAVYSFFMKTLIKNLKKGDKFKFNETIYTVKQKFSDWKKDDNPYLMTVCGQVFWHDELEVFFI